VGPARERRSCTIYSRPHDEEVMGWGRTYLPGLLVDPAYFFEAVLNLKAG